MTDVDGEEGAVSNQSSVVSDDKKLRSSGAGEQMRKRSERMFGMFGMLLWTFNLTFCLAVFGFADSEGLFVMILLFIGCRSCVVLLAKMREGRSKKLVMLGYNHRLQNIDAGLGLCR